MKYILILFLVAPIFTLQANGQDRFESRTMAVTKLSNGKSFFIREGAHVSVEFKNVHSISGRLYFLNDSVISISETDIKVSDIISMSVVKKVSKFIGGYLLVSGISVGILGTALIVDANTDQPQNIGQEIVKDLQKGLGGFMLATGGIATLVGLLIANSKTLHSSKDYSFFINF